MHLLLPCAALAIAASRILGGAAEARPRGEDPPGEEPSKGRPSAEEGAAEE